MKVKVVAAAVALAALMPCLAGCAPEKTGAEQLDEYLALESIDSFQNEAGSDVSIIFGYADINNPGGFEEVARARANLSILCDKVIEEDAVPEKCKDLHEYYMEAAKQMDKAGEYYSKAATSATYSDYAGYVNDLGKGGDCVNAATDALRNAGTEQAKLQADV